MNDIDRHLLTLFAAALDCPSGPARAELLDRECGQDPARRAEVEVLLRAHDQVGRFLEPPAEQVVATLAPADPAAATLHLHPDPAAGTVVAGRYVLAEVIGAGGMGTVWRAEQQEPVRRTVALKLIKSGMDSRAVVCRFEAERQALALMDHPNIATVLDGGATADGRPFFVMELVAGVPITAYCDAHKLTVRQRL
ncbi:MAG TPA: protein kinase, partial [Fimbriiglobus sp.]|nr:protein kinase [Fimbriiglobus sp.]